MNSFVIYIFKEIRKAMAKDFIFSIKFILIVALLTVLPLKHIFGVSFTVSAKIFIILISTTLLYLILKDYSKWGR